MSPPTCTRGNARSPWRTRRAAWSCRSEREPEVEQRVPRSRRRARARRARARRRPRPRPPRRPPRSARRTSTGPMATRSSSGDTPCLCSRWRTASPATPGCRPAPPGVHEGEDARTRRDQQQQRAVRADHGREEARCDAARARRPRAAEVARSSSVHDAGAVHLCAGSRGGRSPSARGQGPGRPVPGHAASVRACAETLARPPGRRSGTGPARAGPVRSGCGLLGRFCGVVVRAGKPGPRRPRACGSSSLKRSRSAGLQDGIVDEVADELAAEVVRRSAAGARSGRGTGPRPWSSCVSRLS